MDEAAKVDEATPGQATPDEKAASHRAVMAGHAISLLNNHIMRYGWRDARESSESWKGDPLQAPDAMHDVPPAIRKPLEDALAKAALFLAATFGGEIDRAETQAPSAK